VEAADDQTAALRAIAWVMVGWAVAIAAIALAYEPLACHHADRARQAAVLSYIVVGVGVLAGVLAAWAPGSTNGRALLRDIGFLVFSIALLVGVVLVLAITRTAHRLAGEMKSGSLPPTAVARTASSERSPQTPEEGA